MLLFSSSEIVGLQGILLFVGAVIAFQVREVHIKELNDSKFVGAFLLPLANASFFFFFFFLAD